MRAQVSSALPDGAEPIPIRRAGRRAVGRRIVGSFCLVLVLALAAFLQARHANERDTAITATVMRGDLEETVMATGKIQPHAYVDVGAQASGQLNGIRVRTGEMVQRGQLLAEIDPQVQAAKVEADEAQFAQVTANLAEQQANVDYAEATRDRLARLVTGDAVSRSTYDVSSRDAKVAAAKADAIRAQIKQIESTLKADRVALGYTRIFAPMAGTVVTIDAREGQTLNAAYATPQILRIADLATMTVWTQVSEADVTRLRLGMPVHFTTLGRSDLRWTATLRQILPAPQKPPRPTGADPGATMGAASGSNVVLYTALFDVDNTAGDLRPEMTAQVSFVVVSARDVVLAPTSALRNVDNAAGLKVTVIDDDGREQDRTVRVGLHTRFEAEILSGLRPGERIVIGRKSDAGEGSRIGFRL